MDASGHVIGVDFTTPAPLSQSKTSFSRTQFKKPILCCLQRRNYMYVGSDMVAHRAEQNRSGCCARWCGCWKCEEMYDIEAFTSQGPAGSDFTRKRTVKCWRYCLCPCLSLLEACCACWQQCGKREEVLEPDGKLIGRVIHPSCWEICCSVCLPGRNRVLVKTQDAAFNDKYIIRSDRTYVYRKYPVTLPNEQTPVAFVTINAQRAWLCDGFCCCYCGHKKTALVEIEHLAGLPFTDRAHLMAAGMHLDAKSFIPHVGCCCNDP